MDLIIFEGINFANDEIQNVLGLSGRVSPEIYPRKEHRLR